MTLQEIKTRLGIVKEEIVNLTSSGVDIDRYHELEQETQRLETVLRIFRLESDAERRELEAQILLLDKEKVASLATVDVTQS